MEEHPIIFNTEMVKAILAGRKTQTRRVPVERYRNWKVGDIIWVRENHIIYDCPEFHSLEEDFMRKPLVLYPATENIFNGEKVRPSIHMPRWASRITLEITGLREEHVQDMDAFDCLNEGIKGNSEALSSPILAISISAIKPIFDRFIILWDSINKKRGYAWNTDPLVKVIEFKVITH